MSHHFNVAHHAGDRNPQWTASSFEDLETAQYAFELLTGLARPGDTLFLLRDPGQPTEALIRIALVTRLGVVEIDPYRTDLSQLIAAIQ